MVQTYDAERQARLNGTGFPLAGHDLRRIPIYPPPITIQTKPALDKSGDAYEPKADWGAHPLLAASVHRGISGAPPRIQRSPDDSGSMQADSGNDEGGTSEQMSLPAFMASITVSHQGKFQSKSRIAGHKRKIEIQSLTVKPSEKEMMVSLVKRVDETSPAFASAGRRGKALTTALMRAGSLSPR
jgi:hypothetical protein